MKAKRFDATAIADAISEMIYDFIVNRQLSVERCIELYDEIYYILEKFDDENTDDIVYDQFDDYKETDLYYY